MRRQNELADLGFEGGDGDRYETACAPAHGARFDAGCELDFFFWEEKGGPAVYHLVGLVVI